MFVVIPGDVTGPDFSPKYGYHCTFKGTPLPKLRWGSTDADDLRNAGWRVIDHFDNATGVSWHLSNDMASTTWPRQPPRTVGAEAKTDKEALDHIRRQVHLFVHEDNVRRSKK